jgi:hypothetical protein
MAAGSNSASWAARHRVAANRLAELGTHAATSEPDGVAVDLRLAQRHTAADRART